MKITHKTDRMDITVEGVSFRELGRIHGISGKSAKKRFMSYLDRAKEIHDDSAFS